MIGEIDPFSLSLMARVYACNARVEAMKAENDFRISCGSSPAYREDAFTGEAITIEQLAEALKGRS